MSQQHSPQPNTYNYHPNSTLNQKQKLNTQKKTHPHNQISNHQNLKKTIASINLPEEYDDPLFIQLIKSKSNQKKHKCNNQIFDLTTQQLQIFFLDYDFFEGLQINLKQDLQAYINYYRNQQSQQQLPEQNRVKIVKNPTRIYFGQVVDHKKHGKGVSIYSDGKIFQGHFIYNQKQGFGLEIYPNGNLYFGNHQKNKKHGFGIFFWFTLTNNSNPNKNHSIIQYYKGQWWGGLPSGKGIHQRANDSGDYYEGQFRNGLKHGQGKETFHNRDVYKGSYINGLPEGQGYYVWQQDQSSYCGQFKQGLRSGFGVWKKGSQSKNKWCESYQGYYLLDKKCGYGLYVWENGQYYKGQFYNDLRNGYGQMFCGKKILYDGMWQNGKRIPQQKVENWKRNQMKEHFVQKPNQIQLPDFSNYDIKLNITQQNQKGNSNNNSSWIKNNQNNRMTTQRQYQTNNQIYEQTIGDRSYHDRSYQQSQNLNDRSYNQLYQSKYEQGSSHQKGKTNINNNNILSTITQVKRQMSSSSIERKSKDNQINHRSKQKSNNKKPITSSTSKRILTGYGTVTTRLQSSQKKERIGHKNCIPHNNYNNQHNMQLRKSISRDRSQTNKSDKRSQQKNILTRNTSKSNRSISKRK